VQRLDRLLADFPIRDIAPPDRPYFLASSIYAIAGRPDKARQLMQRYRAEVTDTALRRLQTAASHVPLGEIALAERRPLDAIAEFRAADRDYDGHPASDCAPCVAFNLARAFDAAEQPDSAIASYERFFAEGFSVRYLPATDGIGRAFAHRRLGELYEARGDAARAASHYKAFVALWKDADAELQPQVADVRRRIQRLERRAR
jgi:tetratricopeptide (TPR) repeat protein